MPPREPLSKTPIPTTAVFIRALLFVLVPLCLASTLGDQQVVIQVGATAYDRAEIQRWLDQTPLADLPASPRARLARIRNIVDEVFVPQALLTEYATDRIAQDAAFVPLLDGALARATERLLENTIEIGEDEIRAFYDDHRDRYLRPEAILIWRILVPDEKKAREVLKAVVDKRLGVYEWGNLARIHSIDEATKHRDGSLGFVRADGTTDVPQVRVDAAIYAAARSVADGEIVSEPVREGNAYALVWRRGTRKQQHETLEEQREAISAVLTRHKLQQARSELLETLRDRYLTTHEPDLLERVVYHLPLSPVPTKDSEQAPTRRRAVDPQPQKSDRGDR